MKKVLFAAAIAAMVLSSCADEKVGGNGPENKGDGITFRTINDKGSRASVTDADNMTSFTVTAWWDKTSAGSNLYGDDNEDNGSFLFLGEAITKGESAPYWVYSPVRYWPTAGTVDYFATSPASSPNVNRGLIAFGNDGVGTTTADNIITYTVPTVDVAKAQDPQEDFLVAVALDKNGKQDPSTEIDGPSVALHFQHALSRVKFNATSIVSDIKYEIAAIRLVGLYSRANLDLTVPGAIPEVGGFYAAPADPSIVLWTGHALKKADVPPTYKDGRTAEEPAITSTADSRASGYAVDFSESPVKVKYSDPLSPVYSSVIGATNALMVMPQETNVGEVYTAADFNDDTITDEFLIDSPADTHEGDFYIVVSYKAYQSLGDTDKDGEEDFMFHAGGKEGADNEWKDKYIPVNLAAASTDPAEALTFGIGRQYTFNLTFGQTNDGDPNPLTAITLVPTVQAWDTPAAIVVGR